MPDERLFQDRNERNSGAEHFCDSKADDVLPFSHHGRTCSTTGLKCLARWPARQPPYKANGSALPSSLQNGFEVESQYSADPKKWNGSAPHGTADRGIADAEFSSKFFDGKQRGSHITPVSCVTRRTRYRSDCVKGKRLAFWRRSLIYSRKGLKQNPTKLARFGI